MSALGEVIHDGRVVGYGFYCPGCGEQHVFWTGLIDRPRWAFDANMERPTFSPSLKNTYHDGRICHLFLRDGQIQFLGDCWHALKGQTVPLEPEPPLG